MNLFELFSCFYQDENMAVTNLQESLESNKAHLQKQLRQKEGDCNRMAVQIRVGTAAFDNCLVCLSTGNRDICHD